MLKKQDVVRLRAIRFFIRSNLDKELTLQFIADKFSISAMTLRRHFMHYYNKPVYSFILQCRMTKAKQLIMKNEFDLNELSALVGYNRYTSFLHAFKNFYNVAPSFFKTRSQLLMNRKSYKMNSIR